MKELGIVIPVGKSDNPKTTLQSLSRQSYQDFDVFVYWDTENKGVSYARNRGAEFSKNHYILFSDADIQWEPDGIERLVLALKADIYASYAYGPYEMGGKVQCNLTFDAMYLKQQNYISTMSVIKRDYFLGFDEDLYRLVDWALWLKMLQNGHTGLYVGDKIIFKTKERDGITKNGAVSWGQARDAVVAKYL